MADPVREPASGDGPAARHDRDSGLPRWVKVFGLVAVIVALLLLVLMLAVGGEHGPGRHLSSGGGAGTSVIAAGTDAAVGSVNR